MHNYLFKQNKPPQKYVNPEMLNKIIFFDVFSFSFFFKVCKSTIVSKKTNILRSCTNQISKISSSKIVYNE